MGAWGTDPWDNDTAADWFGEILTGNPLVDRVDEALRDGESEETYAALWTVAQLARVYVWPISRLDATLRLAVGAADAILAHEDPDEMLELWEDNPELVATLTSLRAEIAGRIRD